MVNPVLNLARYWTELNIDNRGPRLIADLPIMVNGVGPGVFFFIPFYKTWRLLTGSKASVPREVNLSASLDRG
jgi:hypothetical protein